MTRSGSGSSEPHQVEGGSGEKQLLGSTGEAEAPQSTREAVGGTVPREAQASDSLRYKDQEASLANVRRPHRLYRIGVVVVRSRPKHERCKTIATLG